MTRIASYSRYKCLDCGQSHILPNYASIRVAAATDPYVADEDFRVCVGCGSVKPFNQFIYAGTKQKPSPDNTPTYVKLIKRLLGVKQFEVELHPTRVYPYLNSKKLR